MNQRTRIYSGSDGVAMPNADEDGAAIVFFMRTIFGSAWWALASVALVATLMDGLTPWCLLLVVGAELCAIMQSCNHTPSNNIINSPGVYVAGM